MALETMSGEKRMTLETSGLMSTLFPLSSFEFVVNFWRSRRSRDLTQRSEKKKTGLELENDTSRKDEGHALVIKAQEERRAAGKYQALKFHPSVRPTSFVA